MSVAMKVEQRKLDNERGGAVETAKVLRSQLGAAEFEGETTKWIVRHLRNTPSVQINMQDPSESRGQLQ